VQQFFEEQLNLLREFMGDSEQTVRCLHVDPDLKPVVVKMLAGLDRDPDNPHVLIPSNVPFTTEAQFFGGLLGDLHESYEASADVLREAGLFEPFCRTKRPRERPERAVVLYLASLAEGLPDHFGSLVMLLDPAEVADAKQFCKALAWLADNTWSAWVKYLVLDDRLSPRTAGLEELSKRASLQVMYLPPAEIEARVRQKVAAGHNLAPDMLRRYTAMLAGFAIARKDFDAAADASRRQIDLIRKAGAPPAEEAPAQYCLGNALLGKQDFPAAEEAYARALELALAHQQPQLMGLVLTQLGIALHRQGRADEAAKSFRVARETARNVGMPPLEAFALDTQAQCLLADKDAAGAERCWKESLAVYDGITSDAFPDVRDAGRKDILGKLERLYKGTRQPGRWADLVKARGGG
jgi:tetratricopeptide (TPR) repeat protein